MHSIAVALALITLVVNAIAALIGAWSWYRFESPQAFWLTLRAGQVAAVAQALFAGIAFVAGARPDDGLYWLYAVLPVAVGFFAEQLRLTVAHAELDRRDLRNHNNQSRPLASKGKVLSVSEEPLNCEHPVWGSAVGHQSGWI